MGESSDRGRLGNSGPTVNKNPPRIPKKPPKFGRFFTLAYLPREKTSQIVSGGVEFSRGSRGTIVRWHKREDLIQIRSGLGLDDG